jgi:hypothetical protein
LGLDISPKFVEASQVRHPNSRFMCADVLAEEMLLPAVDYIVMKWCFH